jgi:hypothetical protein
MNLGLLALLAIVVLLLLFVRERFEATPTIKDPSTWDAAEITRIRKMITPESTLTETEIRELIGGFWSYSIPDPLGDVRGGRMKGWKNETLQITIADIFDYMNMKRVAEEKRNQVRDLLKAYYIDQGQSVFEQVRQRDEVASTTERPSTGPATPVDRPLTTDTTLRREIASYTGIPVNDSRLDIYIRKIQDFYDIVYLPDKTPPTQTEISSFVRDIPVSDIPESSKQGLEGVIDYWFTQSQTASQLLEGVPQPRSQPASTTGGDGGAGPTELGVTRYTQGPIGAGPGGFAGDVAKPSENIFGPLYTGVGEAVGRGGDTSKTNQYPEILGGYGATPQPGVGQLAGVSAREFDLPSLGSLGLNDNSQFFPYSRTPGDQDGAYMNRIGNTGLSTVQGSKTDPVPFLTDFSAFFR